LRFYRDLGFTDLYVPEGAGGFGRSGGENREGEVEPRDAAAIRTASPEGRGAAPAKPPRPADTLLRPQKRPAQELLGGAENGGTAAKDPLPVLQAIQADIGECTRCRLHEGRSKIVFGSGNPQAKLVFVGEGPGADEDAQGFPFVGRAGQLLTQMINNTAAGEGIPISRDDVYICNVVKCRPPGNRTPEPDEMEICGQFLTRQLDAIRPKAICLLGATAARYLLGTKIGITKLRGNWQEWRGIPVMPTYHPSFLLRPYTQERKREAWEDLKKVLHYVYDSE
jgi:DNA polymerase